MLFGGCNGALFSLCSFNPGAGLPADKKKGGPSPGDVEAIKVNLSGSRRQQKRRGKNGHGSELSKRFSPSPGQISRAVCPDSG